MCAPGHGHKMKSKERSAIAAPTATFIDFWNHRNDGNSNLLDRYSTNNVSFAIAWLAHTLRITPNHFCIQYAMRWFGHYRICCFAEPTLVPGSVRQRNSRSEYPDWRRPNWDGTKPKD